MANSQLKLKIQRLRNRVMNDVALAWDRVLAASDKSGGSLQLLEHLKVHEKKLQWLFLGIVSLMAADFVWLGVGHFFLDPAGPRSSRLADEASRIEVPYVKGKSAYQNVNIFCPGCPIPEIRSRAGERPKDCNKARPFHGGAPTLIGTIVLSQPEYSVATVSSGSGDSDAIKKGDVYKNFGTVYEIRRDRVCFENQDGLLFYAELPIEKSVKFGQPSSAAVSSGSSSEGIQRNSDDTEVQIQRSFLMKQIQDPNLLYQAHAVPYRQGGDVIGFQLISINPGSVYEQLGFSPQDVITEINGEPITSPAKAQAFYAEVESISELNITVLRGGRPVQRSFKVK